MMQVPKCLTIKSITQDTHDVFTLVLENEEEHHFLPGQFNMLYPFGIGESAISLSGDPHNSRLLTHTIRAVGSVTRSLQQLKAGDQIGVRGPFGNGWPLSKKGCDVLLIAGGIGFAPLRSALFFLSEHIRGYGKITLLYGTRTTDDILFKNDMEVWKKKGIAVEVTLDYADSQWRGHVGVVTRLIKNHLPHPDHTLVLVCGPEIMIQFTLHELMALGCDENNIYVAMERKMQCAVGFCGHCLYGPHFICKDGPIFSFPQIKDLIFIKEI